MAIAGCAAFLVGGCAGVSTACDPAPAERLPIRQLGYGCIRAIAFSDDAQRAVTGTTDGTVRVWDLCAERVERTLSGHALPVEAVALSSVSGRIASYDSGGILRLWDAHAGGAIWSRRVRGGAVGCALGFVSDGATVIVASCSQVEFREAATGKCLRTLPVSGEALGRFAFSRDGGKIMTMGTEGVRVYDGLSGNLVATLPEGVHGGFSPDGTKILVARRDKVVEHRDIVSARTTEYSLPHAGSIWSLAFSPDGRRGLAGAHEGEAILWDLSTGRIVRTFAAGAGQVHRVAFSSDGLRVVTHTLSSHTVNVWDVATGRLEEAAELRGHMSAVKGIACSGDGARLTVLTEDAICVWDQATGNVKSAAPISERGLMAQSGVLFPDAVKVLVTLKRRFAAPGELKPDRAAICDTATGREIARLDWPGVSVTCAALSPDGADAAAGGSDGSVRIWDPETGKVVRTIDAGTEEPTALAFSPDGALLLICSRDGGLWEVDSGRLLQSFPLGEARARTAAFARDGRRFAVACADGSMLVRATGSCKRMAVLAPHGREITGLAFSPDGSLILSSTMDGGAVVWDSATGESLCRLRWHQSAFSCAAFSPDGSEAMTGTPAGTVLLWDLRSLPAKSESRAEGTGPFL